MNSSGDIAAKRLGQNRSWMWSQFKEQLMARAKADKGLESKAAELQDDLTKGLGTPRHAARILLDYFLSPNHH